MAALLDYNSSPESSSPSPPPSLSEIEATFYYAGLPSTPRLVARTSTTLWEKPKGLEAYHRRKQLQAVFDPKLSTIWEDKLALKVHNCLDKMGVHWTSMDIVRIGVVGDSFAPVILWIGVKPKSLAGEEASTVAFKCLDILREFNITDIDVEIRESSIIRTAGPMLLPPESTFDPTATVRKPLTHALGLSISAQATPYIVGTAGLFLAEGGDSDQLLLLTARHVVLPTSMKKNLNVQFRYKNPSQRRSDILLLGGEAYKDCLKSIKDSIEQHGSTIHDAKIQIERYDEADTRRERVQTVIKSSEEAIAALEAFYDDTNKNWATPTNRILGHVVWSPPLCFGAGEEQYTEDYAIIRVDDTKIDRGTFKGNMIDLGSEIPSLVFTRKMYPHPENSTSFKYPADRLLKLSGTIPDSELRNPTSLDHSNQPCLMVVKSGSTTGVTIGRANGIMSFSREFEGKEYISKEWPILPYDTKSYSFSDGGDSGAIVVDGLGRIGGLLTGGAGVTESSDISYATPIGFLLKRIRANGFPNAHLNPG